MRSSWRSFLSFSFRVEPILFKRGFSLFPSLIVSRIGSMGSIFFSNYFINFIFKFIWTISAQNFNAIGHIKISQIKIHLIENIEKYIGSCITKLFPHVFKKPNLSLIINGPYNRHDEFRPLSSSRFAILLLVLLQHSRPAFLLQRFPYMHSFNYVIQILTLIGEVSPHFVEEPVTVIPILIANHFIISFFFFVHHEALVVVKRRVHIAFKHEASGGNLRCSHIWGPF